MSRHVTAKQRKESGAHFTPASLARFIAEKLVATSDLSSQSLRVLDPSCGDGELLLAFYDALPSEKRRVTTLIGMDQDRQSVADARDRLSGVESQVVIDEGDFLEAALPFGQQRSIWDRPASAFDSVDIVIANPPYVRTQILGATRAQQLAEVFGLSGRVDLYHAFLAAMTSVIRPGGLLGVITSNRYLTTRGGTATRLFLSEQFDILDLVDLGDTKLFEAAVLPALFFGRRRPSNEPSNKTRFVRIYEASSLSSSGAPTLAAPSIIDAVREARNGTYSIGGRSYAVSSGVIDIGADATQPWSMATSREAKWIEAIDAAAVGRLADFAKVRVGVKTTADSVFIRSDWDDVESDMRPEDAVLKPLLSQDTITRWAHAAQPSRRLLYTHEVVDGRRVPIDFEKRYPKAWRYLLSHRARLEGRGYVIAAGRAWYEIWVPQDPRAWAQPKLVFPDISPAPRFLFDRDGYVVDGNCYWATPIEGQDDDLLFLMLAISNSSFMTRYHEIAFQNMLYSGRRRYLTQYVEKYPVPDQSSAAAKELIARSRQRVRDAKAGTLIFAEGDDDNLVAAAFGVATAPN